MTTSTPSATAATRVPRAGLVAALIAIAAAVIVWLLARSLGAEMAIPPSPGSSELEPMPLPLAVVFTIVVAIGASVYAWLLGRFVPERAAAIFTTTALAVLVVSLFPVFALGLAGDDVVALVVLHVAVGASVLVPLRTALRRA